MDISSSHSDPLRDAVQDAVYRAVQVGSFAMTAVQVHAYHRRTQARITAEQDQRARRALNAQVRAEREADRTRWAPALDPAWLRNASVIETAQAWGAATPYADRNVPWHEPAAATAMTRCEERLRHLHPYAMAHYDWLRSQGVDPTEAMRAAAPLFAYHPRPRDASAVPRPMLETAPRPEAGPAPRTYPDGPAGYIRPGRSVRPCDEDFPLTIREVMAAQAELATAGSPGRTTSAVRRVPPPAPRP
jgi:hypothetical protein